jgi:hypothetical protein
VASLAVAPTAVHHAAVDGVARPRAEALVAEAMMEEREPERVRSRRPMVGLEGLAAEVPRHRVRRREKVVADVPRTAPAVRSGRLVPTRPAAGNRANARTRVERDGARPGWRRVGRTVPAGRPPRWARLEQTVPRVDRSDQAERIEQSDQAERVEPIERSDPVERVEPIERSGRRGRDLRRCPRDSRASGGGVWPDTAPAKSWPSTAPEATADPAMATTGTPQGRDLRPSSPSASNWSTRTARPALAREEVRKLARTGPPPRPSYQRIS